MAWFMWMFEVEATDGRRIHAYKHIDTRGYLHLDDRGNAFFYVDEDRYRQLPLLDVLGPVLCYRWTAADWEDLE